MEREDSFDNSCVTLYTKELGEYMSHTHGGKGERIFPLNLCLDFPIDKRGNGGGQVEDEGLREERNEKQDFFDSSSLTLSSISRHGKRRGRADIVRGSF